MPDTEHNPHKSRVTHQVLIYNEQDYLLANKRLGVKEGDPITVHPLKLELTV